MSVRTPDLHPIIASLSADAFREQSELQHAARLLLVTLFGDLDEIAGDRTAFKGVVSRGTWGSRRTLGSPYGSVYFRGATLEDVLITAQYVCRPNATNGVNDNVHLSHDVLAGSGALPWTPAYLRWAGTMDLEIRHKLSLAGEDIALVPSLTDGGVTYDQA